MSSLPEPSEEQLVIINDVQLGKNIVVNSVAGSGKTTLQLHIAQKYLDKKILLLTYSRKLKNETEVRNESKNLDIYTIHGYYGRLLHRTINNDYLLKNAVTNRNVIPEFYDIIMIDEVQDLTPLLYDAIKLIIGNSQLILVGDDRQCIYAYNGASSKYLLTPELYFENREWIHRKMIYSYRLTPLSGEFINLFLSKSVSSGLCFNKESPHEIRFIGHNLKSDNDRPIYLANAWSRTEIIVNYILHEIERVGINEVCILNNSIVLTSRSGNPKPIMNIYTKLANLGIPIYVRDKNDSNYDISEERGKLLVGTVHSMKGREKKVVFSLLDDYYATIVDNNESDIKVAYESKLNIVYVSYTRHSEILYIIGASSPFRPLDNIDISRYCHLIGTLREKYEEPKYLECEHLTTVTKLIEYRNIEDVENMKNQLKMSENYKIDPTNLNKYQYIPFKENGKTSVAKYYSVLVTLHTEFMITKKSESIQNQLRLYIERFCRRHKIGQAQYISAISQNMDFDLFFQKNSPSESKDIETKIENKIYELYIPAKNNIHYLMKFYLYLYLYLNCPYEYIYINGFEWVDYNIISVLADKLRALVINKEVVFETSDKKVYEHPYLKYLMVPEKKVYFPGEYPIFDITGIPLVTRDWLNKFGTIEEDKYILENLDIYGCREIHISSRTDMIVDGEIWEVKITNSEKDEGILQLGFYLCLGDIDRGRLVNLNTGCVKIYEIKDRSKYISAGLNNFSIFRGLEIR